MKSGESLSPEELKRSGFTVGRGCVPREPLFAINAEIEALYILQLRRLGLPVNESGSRGSLYENAMRLLNADLAAYINTSRLTQDLPSVHRLLVSESIVDIVRALGITFPVISTKASIHLMADELKVPNGYHKTPPHQDWRSTQGSLDSLVLWIPTTRVTASSNPLQVVPGSHRLGLLPTVDHIMTPMVSDERISDASFVSIEVEPGDLIAFSTLLVHRTGDEGDGLVRIALSTRFNNAAEGTFVERGFPTPYKYSYRLDLMTPEFPKVSDVERIFGAGRITQEH
jgi:phytanoyl-CoA hydroxylase